MKKLTNSKKILFSVIIINVCVFGFYAFVYFKIKSNDRAISAYATTAAADSQKDESLRAMKASLDQNKDFLSQVDSFFIPSDGVVAFINKLESLGKQAGVTVSVGSVDVPDETNADGTVNTDFKEALGLQIETEGSWQDTHYFLSILENLPYVVQLNNVSFTLSSAADSILFKGGVAPRTPDPDEVWKGTFDLTVLKLK